VKRGWAIGAVVAVLAGVAITTSSASAETYGTLTIRTLDQNGTKVAANETMITDISGKGPEYNFPSNETFPLPTGTYVVMASFESDTTKGGTDIRSFVGAQVVKVSGATTTTMSGSAAHPFTVSLAGVPNPASEQTDLRVCLASSNQYLVEAGGPAEGIYVIGSTSPYLRMAYAADWTPNVPEGRDVYEVSGTRAGLSTTPATFSSTSLGTVSLLARSGPFGANQNNQGIETLDPAGSTGCGNDIRELFLSEPLPQTLTYHLSPGKWNLREESQIDIGNTGYSSGAFDLTQTVAAGQSYSAVFNRAAWGPKVKAPAVSSSGYLTFDTVDMIDDPMATGQECCERSTSTLTLGNTVLSTQVNTNWNSTNTKFSSKITKTGWYVLQTNTTRYRPGFTYPSTMLSPKTSVKYAFSASPKTNATLPTFNARFLPQALDSANDGVPGALMPVSLLIDSAKTTPKTIHAFYSLDGGSTWIAAAVTSASGYSFQVPDPQTGYVSLRASVNDAAGDYSIITIYNAYGIGAS
jgi:hypothetical protein